MLLNRKTCMEYDLYTTVLGQEDELKIHYNNYRQIL